MHGMIKAILSLLVKGYQWTISPLIGRSCKYYPSCSNYALEALKVHGALKGSWLTFKRLLRCNPFSHGGVDEVPPKE